MKNTTFDYQYYAFLAARIRKKDDSAFTELYEATYQEFYRYAFYFLKDTYLAQDALQEIYISIYENIDSLKSDKLFMPWAKQIAYHLCCDFVRKRKNQRDEATDFSDESNFPTLLQEDIGFQNVANKDFYKQLSEILNEMPVHVRKAFILRYDNQLKLEEIADFMNCSLSSVKRYIKTARKLLKEKIAQYYS